MNNDLRNRLIAILRGGHVPNKGSGCTGCREAAQALAELEAKNGPVQSEE